MLFYTILEIGLWFIWIEQHDGLFKNQFLRKKSGQWCIFEISHMTPIFREDRTVLLTMRIKPGLPSCERMNLKKQQTVPLIGKWHMRGRKLSMSKFEAYMGHFQRLYCSMWWSAEEVEDLQGHPRITVTNFCLQLVTLHSSSEQTVSEGRFIQLP